MPADTAFFIVLMTVSTLTGIFLLFRLWGMRREPGMAGLIWAVLCMTFWSLAYILEIVDENISWKTFWLKAEYLAISFIALAIFLFILVYSGRGKWLNWHRLGILMVIPTLTFLLAATNDYHQLVWAQIVPPTNSPFGPLFVKPGIWFSIHTVYSYLLLLITTLFLIQAAVRRSGIYRLQVSIMLIGIAAPWLANIFYLLGKSPFPGYDWTPLGFAVTMIALEIGFSRYRLVDILPVAQSVIFDAMLDAVLVINLQGRIVDANPACERFFDLEAAELIGQEIRLLFPEWNAWIQDTHPRSETIREITLPNDPERRVFNLKLIPIDGQRRSVSGYLLILNDVTKSVKALAQMRLLIAALEATQNAVVVTDSSGMVQWVNPAFTHLTGYERDEIIGKTPRILKSGHQSADFYKTMWDTILRGEVWQGQLINRRKDGSEYYEEMTIAPLTQADGTVTNFIAVKQDISARKQAEEELRLAHQEALEANRLKTELLASISHDLRTPLGTIMGYAEMMLMEAFGPQSEEQKTATAEILNSANALLTFVNNLIGQAQIETGKIMLNEQPFEPVVLIDSIRSVVNYYAAKKHLTLEIEIDPHLSQVLVGDSYWLRQILLNLVNNAVKFTETGTVRIRFYQSDDVTWAMQVSDTGVGIPEEARETIFDAFHQQDSSTGRKYGGSGLGLSIVKQLTTLMGGRIELESQLGQGSTFTVFLPLKTAQEVPG